MIANQGSLLTSANLFEKKNTVQIKKGFLGC